MHLLFVYLFLPVSSHQPGTTTGSSPLSSHKLGTTTGSSQPPVLRLVWASLVAQTVKNLPAMQETGVQSLGQEDPLKKGMATHSSIFAWRIPQTEEPGGVQPMGSQRVRHD